MKASRQPDRSSENNAVTVKQETTPQETASKQNFKYEDQTPQGKIATQLKGMKDNSFQSRMTAQLQGISGSSSQSRIAAQLKGANDTKAEEGEGEKVLQGKFASSNNTGGGEAAQNNTGMPDNLKTGIENLSGISMNDVKVHHNSPKPAQLQAHAYAQGTDIHLAPGQQQHLPHEAWHVVQQKQGRVQATTQLSKQGGDPGKPGTEQVSINDDAGLEKEADVMGARAIALGIHSNGAIQKKEMAGVNEQAGAFSPLNTLQMVKEDKPPKNSANSKSKSKSKDKGSGKSSKEDAGGKGKAKSKAGGGDKEHDKGGKDKGNSKGSKDKSPAQEGQAAGNVYDLTITGEHRANYRQEIQQMGIYASIGEAMHLADHMQMQVPIFVLDGDRNYLQVDAVGRNHSRNGEWGLLHLGNHYVAIEGAVEGNPDGSESRRVETDMGGDCLFESMLVIQKKGERPRKLDKKIQTLREEVSNNMSDAGIDRNIQEMIMYGNFGNIGKGTQALVDERRAAVPAAGKDKSAKEGLPESLGEDQQGMLTEGYWESLLGFDAKALAKLKTDKNYWKKYSKGGAKARPLETILKTVGPQLLKDIEREEGKSTGQLRLYRSMETKDAEAIMRWFEGRKDATEQLISGGFDGSAKDFHKKRKEDKSIGIIPLEHHIGDEEQARKYLTPGKNVMVEFTLKPGAEQLLFSPEYMAIAKSGAGVNRALAELNKQQGNGTFPVASGNEGNLGGYIGMKPESHGPFSLSIGESDATRMLFQLMIAMIRIIKK